MERVIDYRTSLQHILTGLPSSNVRKRPEDKWAELMDYIDDLSEYIKNRAYTVQRELKVLTRTIDALPARERSILQSRYVNGKQWKDIIKSVPLSESSVYRVHQDSIEHLDMSELDHLESVFTK